MSWLGDMGRKVLASQGFKADEAMKDPAAY
jgi:hypothetical protein